MKTWAVGETYQSVRPFRIEVMRRLGFTERQADFLAHVLVFSGVFMERQFCRFAGLTHGRKSVDFLQTLVDRGYARVIAPGKAHSGRFYHLHYKRLARRHIKGVDHTLKHGKTDHVRDLDRSGEVEHGECGGLQHRHGLCP